MKDMRNKVEKAKPDATSELMKEYGQDERAMRLIQHLRSVGKSDEEILSALNSFY
jgi:hypothetical protein